MYIVVYLLYVFFFSSRRRHTRWNCDWSSDVCSSDLDALQQSSQNQIVTYLTTRGTERCAFSSLARGPLADTSAAGCCKPAATSPFWCGRAVPRSLPPQAS